jgi:2-amino-4-hydroxy-6-hydroxymethyldihydropteridine diphosphokinase
MSGIYLALGSNLGDRLAVLITAVRLLGERGVDLDRCSSVYETEPQGKVDQPAFLNMVIRVQTLHDPAALLALMHEVERALGRERRERWGPRTIDIDLLLYRDQVMLTESLQVPHPRMLQRAFVLVPLIELGPDLPLPLGWRFTDFQQRAAELCEQGVALFLPADSFQERLRRVE